MRETLVERKTVLLFLLVTQLAKTVYCLISVGLRMNSFWCHHWISYLWIGHYVCYLDHYCNQRYVLILRQLIAAIKFLTQSFRFSSIKVCTLHVLFLLTPLSGIPIKTHFSFFWCICYPEVEVLTEITPKKAFLCAIKLKSKLYIT